MAGIRRVQAELALDARAVHGEGPAWDAASGNLLWVDMLGDRLHRTAPDGRDTTVGFDQPVCVAVPRLMQRVFEQHVRCGNLVDNHKLGTYVCVVCGLPLFSSSAKFNSGTGWPSFFQPFDREHITEIRDHSHGMTRVEIPASRARAPRPGPVGGRAPSG